MSVDGTWYNELGSKMLLTVVNGLVTGRYTTAVSASACAQGDFDVAGRADTDESGFVNIGFAVSWKNAHSRCESVTAWSGEYRVDSQTGEERIKTTWLLTLETSQKDDWRSTLVGQDVFTRALPQQDQLESNRRFRRFSNPT